MRLASMGISKSFVRRVFYNLPRGLTSVCSASDCKCFSFIARSCVNFFFLISCLVISGATVKRNVSKHIKNSLRPYHEHKPYVPVCCVCCDIEISRYDDCYSWPMAVVASRVKNDEKISF